MKREIVIGVLLILIVQILFGFHSPAESIRYSESRIGSDYIKEMKKNSHNEVENEHPKPRTFQNTFTRQDEPGIAGTWSDNFDSDNKIEWMEGVNVGSGKVNMNYWTYKKSINITNNQGRISSYQTLLTLNLSVFNYSHTGDNGNDLRFLDEEGRELAYWIEQWDPNGQSNIWINMTDMPTGTTRIWMHYGNPTAGRRSDGTQVFELFDDFEDEQVGNSVIPGGWTLDKAGTYRFGVANKDGSRRWWQYCERWAPVPPHGGKARIYKRTRTLTNWSFEGRVLTFNAYNNNLYTPWLLASFGSTAATATFRHVNPDHVCFLGGSGYQPFQWKDNTWYDFRLTYDGQVHRLYFDNELKASWWHAGDSTDRFYLGSGYFGKNYYDLPRVRKYISQEPTIQVGDEILNPLPRIVSKPITLPKNMRRYTLSVTKVESLDTNIAISVLNSTSNESLQGYTNLSENIINLSALPHMNVSSIRLVAWFTGSKQSTPSLDSWKIEWASKYPRFVLNISDISIAEETLENNILDLSNHFVDDYSSEKSFYYNLEYISDPTNVVFKLEGSILDLVYLAENFTGEVYLRVNYTNGYNLKVSSNLFKLIVHNIDDGPVWVLEPPRISMREDTHYVSNFSLDDFVFDAENDDLEFSAESSDDNLTVEVGDNNSLVIIPELDYFGKGKILVEVRETASTDLFAKKSIEFIVDPVNDPPRIVMDIDDRFIEEDSKLYLDVDKYYFDPDDSELLFMSTTESDNISLSILTNNSLLIEPSPDWFGKARISLAAVDPSGEMGNIFFDVEVADVNDIPRAFILPFSEELIIGGDDMSITGLGLDDDGQIVEYLWESDVNGYLSNTSILDLAAVSPLSQGRHVISFSVMDEDGAWSSSVLAELLITSPLLELEDFSIEGKKFTEGDDVTIKLKITNRGTALAKDIIVGIKVDGYEIDSITFPYIFSGESKTAETIWLAEVGNHNISLEIMDSNSWTVEIRDELKPVKLIEVENDRSYYLLLTSLGFSLMLIILFFVISTGLKSRRRKKILRSLRNEIEETALNGVGVAEAEEIYKACKDKFG